MLPEPGEPQRPQRPPIRSHLQAADGHTFGGSRLNPGQFSQKDVADVIPETGPRRSVVRQTDVRKEDDGLRAPRQTRMYDAACNNLNSKRGGCLRAVRVGAWAAGSEAAGPPPEGRGLPTWRCY